jgi:hypothetical protein
MSGRIGSAAFVSAEAVDPYRANVEMPYSGGGRVRVPGGAIVTLTNVPKGAASK